MRGDDARPSDRGSPGFADSRPIAVISVHSCPYSEIGGAENGGMSVYIREITHGLAHRGIRSVIFTRKEYPGAPSHVDLPEGCELVHIEAGPLEPLDKNALFYHLPDFYRGVAAYAREHDLDFRVIQSHYWLSGWVGRRLGQLWGVPWLHMAHTLGRVKDRDRPTGAAAESVQRIAVEEEIIRFCNRLVAPTATEVEDMAVLYGAERGCVSLVPLGVDAEVFQPVDPHPLRHRLGISPGERVVLFTGRLERLKGVDTLLEALAILNDARTDRDVRLLVLGADSSNGIHEAGPYGGEGARLAAIAENLGVRDRVDFVGAVPHDQLPAYYSLAEVCVVPSHSESFGLVALEAEACGTPVVASRVGGLRQLVIDGISGYTIRDHDPRAYAAAVGRILDDEDLRVSMGRAGRHVAGAYSWDVSADRLIEVYEDAERSYERAAASLLG